MILLKFLVWPLRRGDLVDLPLRTSNEGLLRPRLARAQEIEQVAPSSSPFMEDCQNVGVKAESMARLQWRSELRAYRKACYS